MIKETVMYVRLKIPNTIEDKTILKKNILNSVVKQNVIFYESNLLIGNSIQVG